ncbi:hypothetical protein OG453_44725 [Streptomyces sp. NBC_01381]|uniref:hypothetical protein n=1 Tax=Streptomyces sp. NBC_01381 TaxID=2903845 RepID=UPI0022536DB9|nr:hypothetical protein [Streptomyces sp. NBC_01381]MCX4673664.1 hypothetical protein [Streptomyces sp. NBC_01381]
MPDLHGPTAVAPDVVSPASPDDAVCNDVLRPFAGQPGRWEEQCRRVQRYGAELHSPEAPHSASVFIRIGRRTSWGWMRWQASLGEAEPEEPCQIGVLPPQMPRSAVLARRWLNRRPPGLRLFSLTLPTAFTALVSLTAGLHALARDLLPVGVVVPVMLLVPLYVSVLPRHLDTVARRFVRVIEAEPARAYLGRLIVLHDQVAQAAATIDLPELSHAARLGHRVLWDAAGLLAERVTWPNCDARLRAYEDLYSALARQVAEAAAAHQDLDRTVNLRAEPQDEFPDGPTGSVELDGDTLPPQVLADHAAALGELATAHRYAATQLNSLRVNRRGRA